MANQKRSARAKPLTLVDMSSGFVVLALGMSLAILVFLLELSYKRITDRYLTNDDQLEIKESQFQTKEEIEIAMKYFW